MYRQLFVIRHAKSSWDDHSQPDFDRPLNTRGKSDAEMMAKRLNKRRSTFEFIVLSPSKRTVQTARYFKKEFDLPSKNFVTNEKLYLAPAPVFYETIKELDDKFDSIALVAHDEGITRFVNTLCNVHIDEMPTCGIFSVKANIDSWKDFESAKKLFAFFDYPKNY